MGAEYRRKQNSANISAGTPIFWMSQRNGAGAAQLIYTARLFCRKKRLIAIFTASRAGSS